MVVRVARHSKPRVSRTIVEQRSEMRLECDRTRELQVQSADERQREREPRFGWQTFRNDAEARQIGRRFIQQCEGLLHSEVSDCAGLGRELVPHAIDPQALSSQEPLRKKW